MRTLDIESGLLLPDRFPNLWDYSNEVKAGQLTFTPNPDSTRKKTKHRRVQKTKS